MSNIAKIPLKIRLRAWWEGYDPADLMGHDIEDDFQSDDAGSHRVRPVLYDEPEIEAAQKIWGDGKIGPLGGNFLRGLYLPFSLNETKSVLEIGSGLGDYARRITAETHAYVTGLEADPKLASQGMHLSKVANLAKEAVIEQFDPENMVLDRRYDAILSVCSLYHVRRKDQAIEAIASAIKPQSFAQIVDFVLMEGAEELPEVVAWQDAERREPHLWSPGRLQAQLRDVGFMIKTAEDCSAQFQKCALDGYTEMLERLPSFKADEQVRRHVLTEAEIWVRRLAALSSGGLRVFRVLGETAPTFGS